MIKEVNNDNTETIDTSRTDKYDMSHTNQYDSIENVKSTKNTNDDDKYKEQNSQHLDGNETVATRTKEEKSLIKRLMSMNFKHNFIQNVIIIVTSNGDDRFGKKKKKESSQI